MSSAHVLKQMLEGYLNQAPKSIPNLQQEANKLSNDVIDHAHAQSNGIVKDDAESAAQLPNGTSDTPSATKNHKERSKSKDGSGEDGEKADPAVDKDEESGILSPSESVAIAAH